MFCANCGRTATAAVLCGHCGLDPRIPEPVVDDHLRRNARALSGAGALIEYPGERASLLLAISVLTALAIALSALTAGVLAVVILASLISVRLSEYQQRARMLAVGPSGTHVRLHNIVKIAAFRLDVNAPTTYVLSDETPNAFTSGFWGRHWVVIHSKMLELLTPEELCFVVGHELGHIKREHVTWLILTSPRTAVSLALLRPAIGLIFNNWQLKAEFSADRAGLVACRTFETAARALTKITYWDGPVDVDAELRAALASHEADPLDRVAELLGDHPYLKNRLKRLREFDQELRTRGVL